MDQSTNISETYSSTAKDEPSDLSRTLGFVIGFFGIYFLVIGLFSLLAITVLQNSDLGKEMSDKDIYALIKAIISLFISLSAMFIAYKLIKRLDSGRILFNILTIIVIMLSIAQNAYNQHLIARSFANMPAELAAAAKGSESAASLTVFILPAILVLLAIILNWRKMKAWLTR